MDSRDFNRRSAGFLTSLKSDRYEIKNKANKLIRLIVKFGLLDSRRGDI
jgi:hypothetical protein